jgi:hypothetical protein
MSNKFTIAAFLFIVCACNNPDKEKSITSDSLAVQPGDSLTHDPVPTDTLTLDSLKAEVKSGFNQLDSQTYFILTNYITDPEEKIPATDVQMVDSTCAVIIYPTDEQINALKTEHPEDFMNLADTYSYYQGSAIELLDSIDIGTINAEKRYLTFKGKKSRSWKLDIRKDGAPAWNLIFFNTGKEPQIISVTDLSHDRILEYFGKK